MNDDRHATILYVADPAKSAEFYSRLFGHPPLEVSPGFALFPFGNEAALGLWTRSHVEPPQDGVGGGELCFGVADEDAVRERHARWKALGLPIAQPPTRMDFGYTFCALDPDGHRLRVFAPAQG